MRPPEPPSSLSPPPPRGGTPPSPGVEAALSASPISSYHESPFSDISEDDDDGLIDDDDFSDKMTTSSLSMGPSPPPPPSSVCSAASSSSWNSAAPSPPVERIIYVPTGKVGYLIGHYGRTIWGFERTTGAKIDILRPNSHDYETPVAISGSAEGVRHVLRMIMDLYGCNNYSSRLWNELKPKIDSNGRQEIVATEEIRISHLVVGWLVANGGEVAEWIQDSTETTLAIHQDTDEEDIAVYITGTAEGNSKALAIIREKSVNVEENRMGSGAFRSIEEDVSRAALAAHFGKRKIWTLKKARAKAARQSQSYSYHDTLVSGYSHTMMGTSPGATADTPPPPNSPGPFIDERMSAGDGVVHYETIQVTADELNGLDLSAVCRANNVRAEIVWPPADKHDENSNPYPTRQRELVISGRKANVLNARNDVIRELEY